MELIDYVRALRRRWKIIVGCVLAALLGAIVTAPAEARQVDTSITAYTATHTLLLAPDATGLALNLNRVRLLITTGGIPKAVDKELGYERSPAELAALITVSVDSEVGTVAITMTDRDPKRATRYANAFAKEALAALRRSAVEGQRTKLAALQEQLDQLSGQVRVLEQKLALSPDNAILQAQLNAQTSRYQGAFQEYETLRGQTPQGGLTTLDPASPVPVATGGVFSAPNSRNGRLGLAVLLGLILGGLGALTLDRLDTRLRGRAAVELAFRLPVLAEIPQLSRSTRRHRSLSVVEDPSSATAEAYRSLRSGILLLPRMVLPRAASPEASTDPQYAWAATPEVILVTSPMPGEGKTTTLVNLAVCLAEVGKTVLILDADFRMAAAHRFLDVPLGTGLSDLLAAGRPEQLDLVQRRTTVPGVSLVTSGTATDHPAAFLAGIQPLIERARQLADVVLIDSAPVLGANDAVDLMPHVDSLLVVCRHGRTGQARANQVSQLIARLQVPTIGIAVVGTPRRKLYTSGQMPSVPGLPRWARPAQRPQGASEQASFEDVAANRDA